MPEPPVPAQVVTWLPDGRWVTDPDELAPAADESDASAGEHHRPGRPERDRPRPGPRRASLAHSPLGGLQPAEFRSNRDHLPAVQPGPGRGLELEQPFPPADQAEPDWGRPGSREGEPGRPGLGLGLGRRGPDREAREPAERRSEPAERARRRGRRRVRLARIGARLAGWPRRVVIGLLLVVAAVLALRGTPAQPPAAAVGPTQHVVVAARDVAAGTELAADDLRVVSMPVGIVPSGSSPRAAGLIGRVAAGAIRRGEAITDARVVGPGLAAGLEADESAAVPVRIADPDAAALVRVGDRVDVLGTPVAPDGTQATAGETVTVASAVRVLAVLRSRDPSDGVVLVVATGEGAAHTLASAAARHRLTVNVRPP